MAKEELGKLSPAQLKKLGKVISEAKDLTNQQAEIIEKVLAGELNIGEQRISLLTEYFDIYSRKLDKIARKHSSLNDTFLILDNQDRALATDLIELEKRLKNLANGTKEVRKEADVNNNKKTSKKSSRDDNKDSSTKSGTIKDILKALDSGVKLDKNQFKKLLSETKLALSSVKLDKGQFQTLLTKLSGSLIETSENEMVEPIDASTSAVSTQPNDNNTQVQAYVPYEQPNTNLNAFQLFQELLNRNTSANTVDNTAVPSINTGRTTSYQPINEVQQPQEVIVNIEDHIKASSETDVISNHTFAGAVPGPVNGTAHLLEAGSPVQIPSTEPDPVSDKYRNALKDTEKTAKDFLLFLDGIATDGIAISTQVYEIDAQQRIRNKALVESWSKKEEAIRASMLEMAIAKLQTQEELENRSIELRLSRLKAATDEELKAQELLNKIDLQLNDDPTKRASTDFEAGDTRVRKENAELDIKAYQELENQIAEYRAKLDLETRLKNNGEITAAEAAANEEIVRQYFAARKDAIIKEAREELLAKEQLAQLGKTDPKVAQEYERQLADYKAKLDLKSRQTNNGILSEEEAKNNKRLAQAYFAERREEIIKEIALKQQLEAELAEIAKNDSAVVQEFERQMAAEQAKLDYESRLVNNGLLTQAAAEANAKAVRDEFELRKDELLKEIALKQQFSVENPGLAQAREKQLAEYKAEQESRLRTTLRRDLTKAELQDIEDQAEKRFSLENENLARISKLRKREIDEEAKERAKAGDKAIEEAATGSLDKENNLVERFKKLKRLSEDENGDVDTGAALAVAVKTLSTLVQQLEETIDKVGSYKGEIDTRMQGSSNKKRMGSYWDQLTTDMMSVGAVTPYFRQEDFANNIKELVNKGIAFDLKQRAFLMTIQEKIANTFNVADGTLLRLIRIQQEDSTAGRLGMESALNSFLNNMYETSEYLTDVAGSVRSSLEEMESLMGGAEATEIEYQVQKWMGSLYSVGMSQNAVQSIASALGQIASGQVDALTNGGAGNLLVMAANKADIPIAEILAEGLDSKNTNKLLQATVNYLAEIAESSKDNNIVQQQLADVFGVKASDLRAATNLAEPGTTNDIFGNSLTYGNMIKQLNNMANSMILRTSVGEFMTNVWDNAQYSIASSMANNPITYITYKLAGLLDEAVGGIDLPFINVMGFGVDLNTTVADLMRVAAVTGGILGSLGPMISGLASSFSGTAMLKKMGIGQGSNLEVVHRGKGDSIIEANAGGGSQTTSGSGYAGQSNGNDVKNATVQEANDSKKQQMIKAKEEEPANQVDVLNGTVIKIYELLDEVTKGSRTMRVRVDNYGLTGTNRNTSSLSSNNIFGGTSTSNGLGTSGEGNNGGVSGGGTSEGGMSGGEGTGGGGTGVDLGGGNTVGEGSNGPIINLGGWNLV